MKSEGFYQNRKSEEFRLKTMPAGMFSMRNPAEIWGILQNPMHAAREQVETSRAYSRGVEKGIMNAVRAVFLTFSPAGMDSQAKSTEN